MKFSYQVATPEVLYQPDMTCLQGDFRRNVELLAQLGYDAVELMTTEPASLNWEEMQEILAEQHMTVALICTGEMGSMGWNVSDPHPLRRQQGIRRICEAIDMAAYFKAPINAGRIKGDCVGREDREGVWERATDGFRQICEYAASQQVQVALETAAFVYMGFINTCAEAEKLIRAVDRPNFGMMMDIFHMYVEEPDLIASIKRYAQYNLHVHLADNNRMYPGACGMDFKKILQTFHAVGYDGAFTIEVRQLPTPQEAARRAAQHIKPLLADVYGGGK